MKFFFTQLDFKLWKRNKKSFQNNFFKKTRNLSYTKPMKRFCITKSQMKV